jgi:hypothetical protein
MLETRLRHVLSLLGGNSSLALRIRARLAAEADYRNGTHAARLSMLAASWTPSSAAVNSGAVTIAVAGPAGRPAAVLLGHRRHGDLARGDGRGPWQRAVTSVR